MKKQLARKTGLKRSTKPLRPKPSTLSKARRLRQDVLARDHHKCQALVYWSQNDMCLNGFDEGWLPCHGRATDAAHIFPRREFGLLKYHKQSCIALCRKHHTAYDHHERGVKIPDEYRIRAAQLLERTKARPTSKRSTQ